MHEQINIQASTTAVYLPYLLSLGTYMCLVKAAIVLDFSGVLKLLFAFEILILL